LNRLLRWLLPAGFRGQVAGILFLGLALSQVLAVVLYVVLLPQWQRELRPELAVTKVAMVVRLLESVAPAERGRFARLWDERGFKVAYDSVARALPLNRDGVHLDDALRAQIVARTGKPTETVRADSLPGRDAPQTKHIQVLLREGGLLEVWASVGAESRLGRLEQVALAAFMVFAIGGLWAWLTWMVNAPLTRFAHAAERVGLDVDAPALAERGPAQLRRAIRAFNEMQVRLQRFLGDRTRMLGAISHDLRTPLTRLRLRIETDRVAEDQAKMLGDIETMEAMLSSALAFVRGMEEVDAPDIVDLDSLLQTVCDLISDLGGVVDYSGPARCRYYCKPQAMVRALTNVVANAARYGRRATVLLQMLPDAGFLISVEDEGPGIPDAEKDKVFEPFYRSAAAREIDSEGMGLGLSIARSIILAHGGTIELHDRQPHGLSVQIRLPETLASGRQATL
jgi:signal transduction histidine kinase